MPVQPIGNKLFRFGAHLRAIECREVFSVFGKCSPKFVVVNLIDNVVQDIALQVEEIVAVLTLFNKCLVKDFKDSLWRNVSGLVIVFSFLVVSDNPEFIVKLIYAKISQN